MAAKDDLGRAGEQRAFAHLTALGYEILDRNWRCPHGEIDLIAQRGNEIVIVEVKTRRSFDYGHPFEAIDERKRARLWRLATAWLKEHPQPWPPPSMRVHAIGIVGDDPATGSLEHLTDIR